MDSEKNDINTIEKENGHEEGNSSWIVETLSDWLELLSSPESAVFDKIVKDEDLKRLLRLLTLSLILTGVVLGIDLGINISNGIKVDFPLLVITSRYPATALIAGTMLSVLYSLYARMFGIKISVTKSFFVVLALGLPWLPLIAGIDLIPQLPEFPFISIVFYLAHFILIKPIINFYFGIAKVTRCANWRVLLSIIVPLILFSGLFILMFAIDMW